MSKGDYPGNRGEYGERRQARALGRGFLSKSYRGLFMASLLVPAACSTDNGSEGGERTAATAVKPAPEITVPVPTTFPEAGPAVFLPGSVHPEVQQFGADTFVDYTDASGRGPKIPVGAVVIVDCLAIGPEAAAPTARGKWYHITDDPNTTEDDQWVGRFAAANTFENGDTSGPLESQPAVDPAVPPCP